MSTLFPVRLDEALAEGRAIVEKALTDYKPSKIFACFSGGNDSLAATILASQHPKFTGVLHINTGIGIPEANQFVRDTCARQHWPLIELHPPDKTYDEFVLEHGFPGPASHRYAYVWLKERALDRFISHVAKNSKSDRVLLVTGVRRAESRIRMGRIQEVQRENCKVWVAPLINWTALHCTQWIRSNEIESSPVVSLLHMSGECLCGAFAEMPQSNELAEIRLWYPAVAARIEALQEKAKAAGVPCKWGERPPIASTQTSPESAPLFALCQRCDGIENHDR